MSVLVPAGVRGSFLQPCRRHSGNDGMDPGTEVPGYSRAVPPGLFGRGACARPPDRQDEEAAIRGWRWGFLRRWAKLRCCARDGRTPLQMGTPGARRRSEAMAWRFAEGGGVSAKRRHGFAPLGTRLASACNGLYRIFRAYIRFPGSLRTATMHTAPATQNPELRGTPQAGLFAGLVEDVSKGAGALQEEGRAKRSAPH